MGITFAVNGELAQRDAWRGAADNTVIMGATFFGGDSARGLSASAHRAHVVAGFALPFIALPAAARTAAPIAPTAALRAVSGSVRC